MNQASLKRRDFLIGSSTLLASLAVMGTTGVVMAPDGAWAVSTTVLSSQETATLIKFARAIYPHKKLKDAIYANVAHSLDDKASKNDQLKTTLQQGIAQLQQSKFASLSQAKQVAALKDMETTPFFQSVRGECVTGIYNNPEVWKIFGYEGPSAELGGYIHRGFNDLTWLKDA
ncbi:MAG TPA: gluconate 2-dehydrogenase subunit 3 family protein [Terriglobales bacterium]|nr:gluconate 2-dehydrogenase subunit 3 family protein [Terriglobales bacterium]